MLMRKFMGKPYKQNELIVKLSGPEDKAELQIKRAKKMKKKLNHMKK